MTLKSLEIKKGNYAVCVWVEILTGLKNSKLLLNCLLFNAYVHISFRTSEIVYNIYSFMQIMNEL